MTRPRHKRPSALGAFARAGGPAVGAVAAIVTACALVMATLGMTGATAAGGARQADRDRQGHPHGQGQGHPHGSPPRQRPPPPPPPRPPPPDADVAAPHRDRRHRPAVRHRDLHEVDGDSDAGADSHADPDADRHADPHADPDADRHADPDADLTPTPTPTSTPTATPTVTPSTMPAPLMGVSSSSNDHGGQMAWDSWRVYTETHPAPDRQPARCAAAPGAAVLQAVHPARPAPTRPIYNTVIADLNEFYYSSGNTRSRARGASRSTGPTATRCPTRGCWPLPHPRRRIALRHLPAGAVRRGPHRGGWSASLPRRLRRVGPDHLARTPGMGG